MTDARPLEAPGFLAGVRCFFGGLGFVVRTPGAWPLALVPTVVVMALSGFLGFLSVHFVPGWVSSVMAPMLEGGKTLDTVAMVGLQALGTALAIVFSLFIAFSLAQPLSGPALEALVRQQELALGAPTRPETSFMVDVVRSLKSALVGFLIGTPILALLFVIGIVVPPAQVITLPLKALVVTTVVAWDLADYPLSVRGVPIRTRLAFLQKHFFAVLGMAAGVALLALVPCGVLLAIPFGVAGATRLVHEIERFDGVRAG